MSGDNKKAVGFTTGRAAVDVDRKQKASREEPFPTERIQKGVNFRCENGAASAEADKTKIFKEVGDKRETLDQKVVCMS